MADLTAVRHNSRIPLHCPTSTRARAFRQAHALREGPGLSQTQRILQLEARLPASAASDVISTTCPPEAVGAACGYVKVPLDRRHPVRKKIQIYFELYPHSGSGPAES